MEAISQVAKSFSTSDDHESSGSSSADESMDLSYFESILDGKRKRKSPEQDDEIGDKTRSSSRLLRKRLQSSSNVLSSSDDVKTSFKLERLPTRRPDPNTVNRNALMARENRRKKKEYVTKLEEEIDDYKSENKTLRKILKQQFKAVEKLKHEKNYLKGVLANQTQISSLVKLLKSSRSEAPRNSISSSAGFSSPLGLGDYHVTGDDFDFDETLLSRQPQDFLSSVSDSPVCEAHAKIGSEHNYSIDDGIHSADPGVCLHIRGDQLSLEFCMECAENANRSWLD